MSYNKIIYGGKTLMDLTADTVTADKILANFTAHDASGNTITGTCDYDVNSQDATVQVAEMLSGKNAYARGAKITGTMPNNGGVTLSIKELSDSIAIAQGYHDGSGKAKIDSIEAAKLIAENIRKGITILGVTGSLEPSSSIKVHGKIITPSTTQQTILPDPPFNYLSQVIVNKIPYVEADNSAGGKTVTIAG